MQVHNDVPSIVRDVPGTGKNPDLPPGLRALAGETDLLAVVSFARRKESTGLRPALTDFNRRIFRQADTIDDWYARAIYKAYATAADYSTLIVNGTRARIVLQCNRCKRMHGKQRRSGRAWDGDLEEYRHVHCRDEADQPNMCVNCRCVLYGGQRFIGMARSTLREHRQKLISAGLLVPVIQDDKAVQNRQGTGTMDPGRYDAAQYQIRPGLTLVGRIVRHHDFNAPLPETPGAPNERTCEQCGTGIGHLKATATYCGAICKQAAWRARVTETRRGPAHGTADVLGALGETVGKNTRTNSSSAPDSADGDDDSAPVARDDLSSAMGESRPGGSHARPAGGHARPVKGQSVTGGTSAGGDARQRRIVRRRSVSGDQDS